MPKGQYDRTTSKPRTKKDTIKQFVEFYLREDITEQLKSVAEPWLLAIRLFQQETGIEIRAQTAKNQMNKWKIVNGEVYKIRSD